MVKVTRPAPRITTRRALWIAAGLFVLILACAIWARVAPVDPGAGRPEAGTLPLWVAILASGMLALALGVLTSLIVSNLPRWRVVLHPNWGRVIGAAVLALLTPLVVFSYIPWVLGALAFLALPALGALLVATVLWYPVSCLLVSGIGNRVWRVALFALIWWGAYSFVLLMMGYQVFQL